MVFPTGVELATLTFSNPVTFLGNAAAETVVDVVATASVVWQATGEPIDNFAEQVNPGPGMPGALTVPCVDQAGFTDQSGKAFTKWAYRLTRRARLNGEPKIVTKVWQPLVGQETMDFDNLPGGVVGLPVSAEIPPVISVAGETLVVGAEALAGKLAPFLPAGETVTPENVSANLPERLSEESLTATYATQEQFAAIQIPASGIIPKADIATWGDSITESGQGGGIAWPDLLSDWLRMSLYNGAISGEASADIATRQGGLAPLLTLTGNSIPADTTPVSVALVNPGFGWRENAGANVPRIGNFKGQLNGIPGTLLHSQTTGAWTFTRTKAGTVTTVPANTRFYTSYGKNQRDSIQILWAGRNYPSLSEVTRDTASMVAQIRSGKYIVLGILTTGTEVTGGGGHTTIKAINTQLATTYGDKFFDMRRYLIESGLSQMGITPTAQDNTDIAGDTVPASLRDDNTHPNKYGIQVIARRLARLIIAKGWTTALASDIPGQDDTNPGLFFPSSTSYATHPADSTVQGLQSFSVEHFRTFNVWAGVGQNIISRAVTAGDQRSWGLQSLTTGILRAQVWGNGLNPPQNVDSTVALPYTSGVIGIRVDFNKSNNQASFYYTTDAKPEGATWTKLGADVSTGAGTIYVSTAPIQLGTSSASPQGVLKSVAIRSLDRATTHYSNDFTVKDADDANWSLYGGAYMTPA